MKLRIFCGVSVSADECRRVLPQCEVRGPIRRGDIHEAIEDAVNAVGIIDARFQRTRAVSPSEIMDGLRSGMRLYGSSSVGALRAAELDRFGMIGVGQVFDLVRRSPCFRDDLLAQAFADGSDGVEANGTVPYVDLHLNLLALSDTGSVTNDAAERLCELYAGLHFSERSPGSLEMLIEQQHDGDHELLTALRLGFAHGQPMRSDGLQLLATMRADLDEIATCNEEVASLQRGDRGDSRGRQSRCA